MKYLIIRARSLLVIVLSIVITLPILFNIQTAYAQSLPSPFLSDSDKAAVLAWIARETAAAKSPYCYRPTYGRGAGTIPSEAGSDRIKIGALSYSQCPVNTKRVGFDCHSICPNDMRDDGLFCRISEYGRGAGYVKRSICERNAGNWGTSECDKYGLLFYPKCRSGYSAFGSNICRPNQPDCNALGLGGRFDLSCAKRVFVGDPKPLVCSSEKENDAGLCYPTCRNEWTGEGPVCWQNCAPGTFTCFAGCAKDARACTQYVSGTYKATQALAVNSALLYMSLGTSKGRLTDTEQALEFALDSIQTYQAQYEVGRNMEGYAKSVNTRLSTFTSAFESQMEEVTSKYVVDSLHSKFGEQGFVWIAKEYAKSQLQVVMSTRKIAEKTILSLAPVIDPIGVIDVVEAFKYPICDRDMPFPSVTILNPE